MKDLEEIKHISEKKYKQALGKVDSQLKTINHELNILNIKLREKDQEVKLNDLKIKELQK